MPQTPGHLKWAVCLTTLAQNVRHTLPPPPILRPGTRAATNVPYAIQAVGRPPVWQRVCLEHQPPPPVPGVIHAVSYRSCVGCLLHWAFECPCDHPLLQCHFSVSHTWFGWSLSSAAPSTSARLPFSPPSITGGVPVQGCTPWLAEHRGPRSRLRAAHSQTQPHSHPAKHKSHKEHGQGARPRTYTERDRATHDRAIQDTHSHKEPNRAEVEALRVVCAAGFQSRT